MKKYLYLSTAIVGVMIGGNVWAQCVSTQDCTALGYTETSCPNGNGVKCPFGNKWFCGMTKDECEVAVCEDFGFIYECNGQYEVGVGKACGTRYTECECEAGYERTEGICAKPCASHINITQQYCMEDYENRKFYYCCAYTGYQLKSEEFVNGKWECEYNTASLSSWRTCVSP